ncbi:MAG TPA: hypothetical protein VF239_14035 [Vicinamibacterales bacterium]
MIPAFIFLLLLAQAVAPPAASQAPQPPAPPADPASSHFTTDAGILLVTIKPAALADYEMAIRTLQEALAKDQDSRRAQAAKGWRVFRAAENDAKGNFVFVHVMLPAVVNFDYRPSLLLDELIKELPADMLTKYQDAFAAPPTKLTLTEFAAMSVAPVEKKAGGEYRR